MNRKVKVQPPNSSSPDAGNKKIKTHVNRNSRTQIWPLLPHVPSLTPVRGARATATTWRGASRRVDQEPCFPGTYEVMSSIFFWAESYKISLYFMCIEFFRKETH